MSYATIDALPQLLPKKNGPPLHAGLKDAVTLGLSPLLSGAGKAAELSPLLAEELLRHLHRKLHDTIQANARAGWFGGRWYNIVTSVNPNYITLSGAHLKQTFRLFDMEDPKQIQNDAQYLLRTDIAWQVHDALGAQLNVADDVLSQGLS